MQIGLRLHDGEKLPIELLLPKVREKGFKCVHIALGKSISEYKVGVSAMTPGFAMYLKNLFAENHLDISIIGCYLNLATPDEVELKASLEKYLAHIRFASILGCGMVGTETGAPNIEYKYVPECREEKALNTLIKNLKTVVSYAEHYGVNFAIEPVLKHIVYSPQVARIVLDEIDSPNLGIIFDPVNMLGVENCDRREEVFADAIRLLGKDIWAVHIKDYIRQGDDLTAVGAGKGEMDYSSVLSFVKKEKPFIHTTLENTTPENSIECRKYIERIYNESIF